MTDDLKSALEIALEKLEGRGDVAVNNIIENTKVELKRKILGD